MNIKTLITTLLLFSLSVAGYAQKNTTVPIDTIFLDKQKTLAKSKGDIAYYRFIYHAEGDSMYKLEDYYRSGMLESVCTHKTGEYKDLFTIFSTLYRHGEYVRYSKDGNLLSSGTFESGFRNGKWIEYYDTTQRLVEEEQFFNNYKKVGQWRGYYKTGQLETLSEYRNDTLIYKMFYDKSGNVTDSVSNIDGTLEGGDIIAKEMPDEKISLSKRYAYIEKLPKARYNIYQFMSKHTVYPDEAIRNRSEGRVDVRFVVDEQGYITNPEVVSEYSDIWLAKSALITISKLPKWKPGMQNGVPVKVYYTLPVTFKM